MLHKLVLDVCPLLCLCLGHATLEEALLSASLDLVQLLHGLNCLHHEVAVVADGLVAALFKLEHGITGHLLAVGSTVGFGPAQLTWVLLGLKQSVALR